MVEQEIDGWLADSAKSLAPAGQAGKGRQRRGVKESQMVGHSTSAINLAHLPDKPARGREGPSG
jgi:hypothetical protein